MYKITEMEVKFPGVRIVDANLTEKGICKLRVEIPKNEPKNHDKVNNLKVAEMEVRIRNGKILSVWMTKDGICKLHVQELKVETKANALKLGASLA